MAEPGKGSDVIDKPARKIVRGRRADGSDMVKNIVEIGESAKIRAFGPIARALL
jgi:hypothetical protein